MPARCKQPASARLLRWLWDEATGAHERQRNQRREQERQAVAHAERIRQMEAEVVAARLWRANSLALADAARAEAAQERARLARVKRMRAEAAPTLAKAPQPEDDLDVMGRMIESGELRGDALAQFLNRHMH